MKLLKLKKIVEPRWKDCIENRVTSDISTAVFRGLERDPRIDLIGMDIRNTVNIGFDLWDVIQK